MPKFYLLMLCLLFLFSCTGSKKDNTNAVAENPLFTLLDSSKTNIMFNNTVKEDFDKNITGFYQGFYSGGGVAVGDLNNDGLDDIYFSGNMSGDKLYRNLGN